MTRSDEFMTTKGLGWNLCGYQVTEELYRDAKTVVYRSRQIESQLGAESRSVIIKVLVSAYPTDLELLNFRHQYTIAKNLDLPGVVRLKSLEVYERGYALVMADFGGVSLERYRQHQRLVTSRCAQDRDPACRYPACARTRADRTQGYQTCQYFDKSRYSGGKAD